MCDKLECKKSNRSFFFASVVPAFIAITATALYYKTDWLIIVPLYISLCVMFLQSAVNKYAYLLGSINSLFYGAVNIYNTLYSTAASDILVSFPLSVITFINWKKHSQKGAVVFKKLSLKGRLVFWLIFLMVWLTIYTVFSGFNSSYIILDSLSTTIGLSTTILCACRFSEYPFFQITGLLISTVTYITMLAERPMQLTYIIYNMYALACVIRAVYSIRRRKI